ncbi:hypothetical protein GCM10010252_12400 [Streptomyces aureoverticillatus]|nr:hypothetical protein GCM10010252_12400 [Streptomyces aureoverticillatus]
MSCPCTTVLKETPSWISLVTARAAASDVMPLTPLGAPRGAAASSVRGNLARRSTKYAGA